MDASLDLFAGIRVRDYDAAGSWYERLLGKEAAFFPHATEAVWELAEHRYVFILEDRDAPGGGTISIFVDHLDGLTADIASRGIEPTERETYTNGVRKGDLSRRGRQRDRLRRRPRRALRAGRGTGSSWTQRCASLGAQAKVLQGPGYARAVAHYLFNFVKKDAARGPAVRERAVGFLRVRMWGIDAGEPHGSALAPGDLVLIYLGAPEREFIGRAEVASAVHDWTPSEAQVYPGDSPSGVLLAQVEEWDPPVAMTAVLSQMDPAEKAKADFQAGVVRITAHEFETALAVAAGRTSAASETPRAGQAFPR